MVKNSIKHVGGVSVVRSYVVGTLLLAAVGISASTMVASAGTLRSSALVAGGTTSLLVPGITGSGTPKGPGYIDVLSWSWGINNIGSQSSSAGAGRTGKVHVHDISITKVIDQTSPLFWKNCAAGSHYKEVVLYMDPAPSSVGAPSGDSMVLTLENVLISGVSLSGGGDRPTESVSFTFSKIKVDYFTQSGEKVHFGYDVKASKLI